MATVFDDRVWESPLPLPSGHVDLLKQVGLSTLLNSLGTDPDSVCKRGLFFKDGQRKVDYILVYTFKKSSNHRTPTKRSLHSNSVHSLPGGTGDLEAAEQKMDYHEDDKRLRREEFEGKLTETGLELEKDEEYPYRHCVWLLSRTGAQSLNLRVAGCSFEKEHKFPSAAVISL
ncbi:hypothetical protein GDO86_008805 [Hymenochirus boettgeri]|uniref:Anoctamin dimerisation domain-containing protein n=1 Tax=Hymenochirus boettgeri TaxID=247094 RepID=A0A8T2J743_9PIPI|nr:hypothetical protein GDO86_008805 [Hymenochirus boettgeri]